MDFFDSRYFRINKLFLSLTGLWPYLTSNIKYLSLSFSVFSVTVMLSSQVIYFLRHCNDLDEVFEIMLLMAGAFIDLMKVICLSCNIKKFKMLLQLTQEDWNNLPKSQETQIITRYLTMGRKFTLTYLYCLLIFSTCYGLLPFAAPVLDIILPLNETRPRKLLYPAEYFVSQEKYYYIILLNEYVDYVVCCTIVTATDTTYFMLLEFICGMQAILCHRLKNLKASCKLGLVDKVQLHESDGIVCRVRRCINLDRRIRKYIEIMESTFETFLLIDIALGVIIHTCTCVMIVIRAEHLYEIMRYIAIVIIQSIRYFLISWTGQQVIDHSSDIPIAAYDAVWYLMPIRVQKMLMLLIARGQNPSRIKLAGIYIINLESFIWVMKTSVSYCTIMISVRDKT